MAWLGYAPIQYNPNNGKFKGWGIVSFEAVSLRKEIPLGLLKN
jgi:hypothetical protein